MAESSRGVRKEARTTQAAYRNMVHPWRVSLQKIYDLRFLKISSDFWRLEIERTKGEVALFLGPKSKHTQFHKMCLDPTNEKFKVEKEDDLQVFFTFFSELAIYNQDLAYDFNVGSGLCMTIL